MSGALFSTAKLGLIKTSVVTNFLFAHRTNNLADEKQAGISRNNSRQLLLGIHVNKHLPWIPDFLELLPTSISRPLMPAGLIDMFNLFDVSVHTSNHKLHVIF